MKLELGLVADNAYIDQSGKFFILGEFKYLSVAAVPTQVERMSLALRITARREEVPSMRAQLELKPVDEDGDALLPPTPPMGIQFSPVGPAAKGWAHSQIVIELGMLPITKLGRFQFGLWLNGNYFADIGFHVIQPPGIPQS